jgi:hypothetical protein
MLEHILLSFVYHLEPSETQSRKEQKREESEDLQKRNLCGIGEARPHDLRICQSSDTAHICYETYALANCATIPC